MEVVLSRGQEKAHAPRAVVREVEGVHPEGVGGAGLIEDEEEGVDVFDVAEEEGEEGGEEEGVGRVVGEGVGFYEGLEGHVGRGGSREG